MVARLASDLLPRVGDRAGLVLGGGGARGAYEVGVLQVLVEEIAPAVGRRLPVDVICGTSAGAINGCTLAAFADEPAAGVAYLARRWTDLRLDRVVRADRREVMGMVRVLLGCAPPRRRPLRGGILNPLPFQELLTETVPFPRIGEHIAAGRLHAAAVTATDVATGRTTLFVETHDHLAVAWRKQAVTVEPTSLTASHAMASAAIPLLLPPVEIRGRLYCDGSLRQNVPLSPARHLGVDRMLVVSTRHAAAVDAAAPVLPAGTPPSAVFLAGKALNALIVDRMDSDVDRLEKINAILAAGHREFGPGFVDNLNRALGDHPSIGLRPIATTVVRPKHDIGRMAADFVRSRAFKRRVRGVASAVFSRLAEESGSQADLIAYVLFDGAFAYHLLEMGRADARQRRDDLVELLTVEGRSPLAAPTRKSA